MAGTGQSTGGTEIMEKNHWDAEDENELPVYRQLQEVMEGKEVEIIEKMCESILLDEGINARFLPSEIDEDHPSVVRSLTEDYSVGIPLRRFCKIHYCAEAVYVIYKEKMTPGFLKEYISRHEILNEKPHVLEILKIQYVFECTK